MTGQGTEAGQERVSGAALSEALGALASEQRRAILHMLSGSTAEHGKSCCAPAELCACKLVERLGLAQSTVSHHMAVLQRAGLVTARRDGSWVYYTLRRDTLDAVAEALRRL